MALIKCPECGHHISDKAKECPKCGYALKQDETSSHSKSVIGGLLLTVALGFLVLGYWWMIRMPFGYIYIDLESGFLWGGIAVWCISFVTFYFGWKFLNQGVFKSKTATIISCIFGVIMVYAFGLASFNTINRDKRMAEEAEYERMAEQRRAEQLQKEQEEAEQKKQQEETVIDKEARLQTWNYADETDPMTDQTSHAAQIYSLEKRVINGVQTPLVILIHRKAQGEEPIVLMGLCDSRCKFRDNMPLLYYRVNGGEEEYQSYMATANNVICIGGKPWVETLKKADKLAVRIELADGSTATFSFNTSGLEWD